MGVLHASLDGGDTLNVAVAIPSRWADPVLVLRRGEREIELPTQISTDLGGLRRAESSVRLTPQPGFTSALPVVVLDSRAWRIELRDDASRVALPLILDRRADPPRPRGASWSIDEAADNALVVRPTSAKPYPRVETIGVGFTSIEVAGSLVGPWGSPLTLLLRLRGEEFQIQAPVTGESLRWQASLPPAEMIGHDGVWECHLHDGHQTRLVRARLSSETDQRFDLETQVRLIATSNGGLVRVRGYTTTTGDLHLSTTTINEETS